jgi:hypothetical protein
MLVHDLIQEFVNIYNLNLNFILYMEYLVNYIKNDSEYAVSYL